MEKILKEELNISKLKEVETIQTLWSGYGKLSRYSANDKTIIVKNIILPKNTKHPRGWNTSKSHQRKVKSYQIETYWYKNYSNKCNSNCKIPKHIYSASKNNEFIIVLEDLDAIGFNVRKTHLTKNEAKVCLKWLANFHATYINVSPKGLWSIGTYWHLATRPDEFEIMKNGKLKEIAHLIDKKLNNCKYQTIVHGDAKVANFCFSKDLKKVAAVDFQYVGGGCGIKDVVYFIGSCLNDDECEKYESELLDFYFQHLKEALVNTKSAINFNELETEWRYLFSFAWTDFTRFLLGWMPTHQKLNTYSEKLKNQVLKELTLA